VETKSPLVRYHNAVPQSNVIRLATRGSALALWQAERVTQLIEQHFPDVAVLNVVISTRPDREPEESLSQMGGDKGLFTKEVEQAVLSGRADAAIHSLKDVPVDDAHEAAPGSELPLQLPLVAFPERADSRDVLVSRHGATLAKFKPGAVIATSSLRRRAQMLHLRPDLATCDIRGNVDSRIEKLHARKAPFDAMIMAAAGLQRLGMEDQICEFLPLDKFLPAPGQGILAIQAPAESAFMDVWKKIDNPYVRLQAECERELARRLGATCRSALGCHLQFLSEAARLDAVVCSPDGQKCLRASSSGNITEGLRELAARVADDLLAQGAGELL